MTYYECIKQISSEEIFDGLLGFGLFSERLPPFLTSEPYLNYAKKHASPNEQYASQFMFYDNYRNINIPRILAIPSPISYRNLCRSISDNWEKIQNFFQDKTRNQSYKISRIHIRKLAKSKALFKMNYDNWKIDGFPEPDLLIDKKFLVKADIANCFPSMYTHSLCWALVGKNEAKKNKNNKEFMEKEKRSLEDKARELIEYDFGRFWLFIYEILPIEELPPEYMPLKKANISFIDKHKLSYKDFNDFSQKSIPPC